MYNNELIMYVNPCYVSFYDMFILMFSRWKLEQEDKIGETLDWYSNQMYNPISLKVFVQKKILVEVEKNLYAVDEMFTADQFFVSIDKQTSIYLYELLTQFKERYYANIVLGLYIFFLSRSRVKAYKGDLENVQFGLKTICRFLNMKYTEENKSVILGGIIYLVEQGIISYFENNKKYTFPYELDGVMINCDEPLMNVEQIYQKFYK